MLQPVACLPSGDGFSAGIFLPCSDSGLLSIIMVSDPDVESDVSSPFNIFKKLCGVVWPYGGLA